MKSKGKSAECSLSGRGIVGMFVLDVEPVVTRSVWASWISWRRIANSDKSQQMPVKNDLLARGDRLPVEPLVWWSLS